MIYNFTWSGLNTTANLVPREATRFGTTLSCALKPILEANPTLGLIYLIKVDLVYTYMRLWVRMEYVPSLSFLINKKHPSNPHRIGFNISLLMDYIDSTTYFYATVETATDMANT